MGKIVNGEERWILSSMMQSVVPQRGRSLGGGFCSGPESRSHGSGECRRRSRGSLSIDAERYSDRKTPFPSGSFIIFTCK